jgi:formate dehydrogenase maturation protein FdhE
MRTTLDLDGSVLEQLKALQREERKSLGALASELLAKALADRESAVVPPFGWAVQPMGAKADLEDRDAVQRLLDDEP